MDDVPWEELSVEDPQDLIHKSSLSKIQKDALLKILKEDPRPRFDIKPESDRVYGFYFAGFDVRFTVNGGTLFVKELVPQESC